MSEINVTFDCPFIYEGFDIRNTVVYNLEEAIVHSGNPLRTRIRDDYEITEKDYARAKKLASAPLGSGHYQFLTGINVHFDIYAPSYMWPEIQRYHFLDFESSQSKMHCLTKFNIDDQCNNLVWSDTKTRLQLLIDDYNAMKKMGRDDRSLWYEILSNVPMGFVLGASMTTNYSQLRTIYHQRKHHKLQEWHAFCNWIKALPMSYLITGIEPVEE